MNGFLLKIIALICMTVDHVYKIIPVQTILIEQFGMTLSDSSHVISTMALIGRISFPIFAFGIAQGCMYTKNINHYIFRLLCFGLISEVPFQLAFSSGIHIGIRSMFTNIFFTLALGAAACKYYHLLIEKKVTRWLAMLPALGCCLLSGFLNTDYSFWGVLVIFIPFIFEGKRAQQVSMAVTLTVFYLGYKSYNSEFPLKLEWLEAFSRGEILPRAIIFWIGAMIAVILIGLYNGRKGPSCKWLFYIFYPCHLIVLYLLRFVA